MKKRPSWEKKGRKKKKKMLVLIHPLEGSNLPPVCCVVAMEKKANTRTCQSVAR